jgi:hypothetical protein
MLSRRSFAALAATPLFSQSASWTALFDGRSLDGWKASGNAGSWRVDDGTLFADGPVSHLFYSGPVRDAMFKNFELEVEAIAAPGANSGVYFHTAFQPEGFPRKGFEVQINHTAHGEGTYRERKRTGSLYGLRNVYKTFVRDNQWFTLNVLVRGKNIQVRLNGMLVADYTEPSPPVIVSRNEPERYLDSGTFALQCHDPGSKVRFRSVRVRPLPDDATVAGPAPSVEDSFRDILTLGTQNYPLVDLHVHLKGGLTLDETLAQSRRDGIFYGIAVNCGKGFTVEDDASLRRFVESMKSQPCFVGMQAEGREWTTMFSREAVSLFDYVFTDSMTWTDNRGKRMRTWIPAEVGDIPDAQEFMETLTDRAVSILTNEPIDIYVNPTYLPDAISKDYATLWTPARMQRIADAAAANQVAVELNDRYSLPSPEFVRVFHKAGCKFTFGTNNGGRDDLRRSDYGRRIIRECSLKWSDFWLPGAFWPRAVDRKGSLLKS